MFKKHLFIVPLVLVVASGCDMLDRQTTPNVTTPPAYWQSQGQLAQSQLEDVRAFHERESAEMSEEMHVFRNREMERLTAAGRELEKENSRETTTERSAFRQEGAAKNPEPKEKWSWASLFKKKNKDATPTAPLVSETGQNVR